MHCVPVLEYKKCIECTNPILTLSKTPYCKKCIKTLCVMSKMKNIFGYIDCNATVDHVFRCGRVYCMGHYKQCLSQCRICKEKRKDEHLSLDGWFYCDKHKPSWELYEKVVTKILSNKLNYDLAKLIFDQLKNNIENELSKEYNKHIISPKERYTIC